MDPAAESALIQQVDHADPDQLARLLARPTAEEEEVLVAHLGDECYVRMHERALQRNLRRAAEPPLGNVMVIHGIMGSELSTVDRGRGPTATWAHALKLTFGGLRRLELDEKGGEPARLEDECGTTAILTRYYGELPALRRPVVPTGRVGRRRGGRCGGRGMTGAAARQEAQPLAFAWATRRESASLPIGRVP
jgi:hypothetical protein